MFFTDDVVRIPAYSGKPINTLVGIDLQGRIAGLAIVEHEEPILAVGVSEARLAQFTAQYAGKSAFDRIVIGARRDGHLALDGISGATITVMVRNATVMRSARAMAEARGGGAGAAGAAVTAPGSAPQVTTAAEIGSAAGLRPIPAAGDATVATGGDRRATGSADAPPSVAALAGAMIGRWAQPGEPPLWVTVAARARQAMPGGREPLLGACDPVDRRDQHQRVPSLP